MCNTSRPPSIIRAEASEWLRAAAGKWLRSMICWGSQKQCPQLISIPERRHTFGSAPEVGPPDGAELWKRRPTRGRGDIGAGLEPARPVDGQKSARPTAAARSLGQFIDGWARHWLANRRATEPAIGTTREFECEPVARAAV